jgi:hypothetical protein
MKPDKQKHYRELVLRAVAHIHASLDDALQPRRGSTYERYLDMLLNAAPHELKTQLLLPLVDADGQHGAEVDGEEGA